MHAGSSAIHTAIELRRLMGLPLHISVQDDVEGHVGRVEGAYLREGLKTLLRTADSADLTSSGMLDYYRDRYDLPTRTEVLITGGDGGPLPASPEVRPTLTRIGFAGNLWASDAMRVLLGALERLNRRRAAPERIAVEAFSAGAPSQFREHDAVKYRGLLPTASLTAALQECDLLYVPMSFLPRYEVLCRTSMAGKAVHYMQAQVPLLAHGPS